MPLMLTSKIVLVVYKLPRPEFSNKDKRLFLGKKKRKVSFTIYLDVDFRRKLQAEADVLGWSLNFYVVKRLETFELAEEDVLKMFGDLKEKC